MSEPLLDPTPDSFAPLLPDPAPPLPLPLPDALLPSDPDPPPSTPPVASLLAPSMPESCVGLRVTLPLHPKASAARTGQQAARPRSGDRPSQTGRAPHRKRRTGAAALRMFLRPPTTRERLTGATLPHHHRRATAKAARSTRAPLNCPPAFVGVPQDKGARCYCCGTKRGFPCEKLVVRASP